jgi:hypothetical protein
MNMRIFSSVFLVMLSTAAADGVVVKQVMSGGIASGLAAVTAEDARQYESGFKYAEGVFSCDNGQDGKARRGAVWSVTLNQSEAAPIAASAWARSEGVTGTADPDYSLYIDLIYMDGTPLWGQVASFDPDAAVGWHQRQVVITPDKPVRSASIYLLFRNHAGKAMFKDLRFSPLTGDALLRFDGNLIRQMQPIQSGFMLRDVAADSDFVSISKEALGVRLITAERLVNGVTFYDVSLEDLTGKDRALTLVYTSPVDGQDLTWFHHPRRAISMEQKKSEVMNTTRHAVGSNGLLSRYPFGAVAAGGQGVAVGLDPATPLYFRIGCQPQTRELFLACDIGLAPEKTKAGFSFCVFDFEAAGGFRSALSRYYALYPDAFKTRIKEQGIWMPFAAISKVEGWQDFGFRFKEGDNETAWDDAHAMLTFRYTEPMTWWMPLKGERTLISGETEARALAAAGNKHALAWQSSTFEDEKGRVPGRVRDTPWCDGVVWSINSAPGVAGEFTDFKQKWNPDYIEKQYGSSRKAELDGEYIDSSEAYVTDELDFRRSHFAGMERPLCYSLHSHKVGIYKGMIGFEYVRALEREIHQRGHYMMANSTPLSWFWLAPLLDVMGTETDWNRGGKWNPMSDEDLLYRRAMCRGKPYCFLMNSDFSKFSYEASEKFMKRCLAYGMFPGYFSADASTGHYFSRPELYNRDRPLFKKYVPLCQLVAEAGWEPLTGAVSDNESVIVEQFGVPPGLCYLTIYNLSESVQRVQLTLTALASVSGKCRELVSVQEVIWTGREAGFELQPGDVRVTEFND